MSLQNHALDQENERPTAGAAGPSESDALAGEHPDDEPLATGTLFVMMLFLMALAGMWLLMYLMLLGR